MALPDDTELDYIATNDELSRLKEEVERLNTWDGLMSLVDEHYPSDIFDGSSGDPGPRMVVLLREVTLAREERDSARAEIERLRTALTEIRTAVNITDQPEERRLSAVAVLASTALEEE